MSNRFDKKAFSPLFIAGVIVFALGLLPAIVGSRVIAKSDQVVSLWSIQDTLVEQEDLDMPTIKGCMEHYSFGGIDEDAIISAENRQVKNITVQYVDGHYDKVIEPCMIKGRWLMLGDASMQNAVIDEALAFELFRHTDCIGETFVYLDKTYQVIALCESQPLFTSRGDYIVYLMYKEGSPVDYVSLMGKPSISHAYSAKALNALGDASLKYHTVHDVNALSHQVWFLVRLLILPPAILILIFSYQFIKKWIKRRINNIREKLKVEYAREMMQEIILVSLGAIVLCGIWILALVGLYSFLIRSLIHLEPFIPIPPVNLRAIWQTITSAIIRVNNNMTAYNPPEVLQIIWGKKLIGFAIAFFYTGGILMLAGQIKAWQGRKQNS